MTSWSAATPVRGSTCCGVPPASLIRSCSLCGNLCVCVCVHCFADDPKSNKTATAVPLSTLFVGRLSYDTTEDKLQEVFEEYGPVSEVKMVKDSVTGKSRGYAFVQFEKEDDMKDAYRRADGMKVCACACACACTLWPPYVFTRLTFPAPD